MARVFLLCLAIIGAVDALPNGAPAAACDTMTPKHGVPNVFSGPEYDIASACYVILPTEFMKIRVWDRFGAGQFKGLFMQVRDGADKISGTWSIPDGVSAYKAVSCGAESQNAVTHTSNDVKKDSSSEVTWTAPAVCKQNEEFTIKATIVKAKNMWQKVEIPMVCNADYSNVAVMERVRPPRKIQYCAQGSWAIIPNKATENFEKRLGTGSWRHFYGAPGMRFERVSAPAAGKPNPDNLPSAQQGSWYLYYKSKGTKKHDMAGLLSPFGIQGCFCLSFDCHMATDGITKFTLSTIGDIQKLILSTTEITSFWRKVSFSFLTDRPVVFAFQVFNSGAQTGGVGLDNILVKAGPCDSTADGYSGYIEF